VRADDVALVGGLCLEFSELRGLLQRHLDDYDGLLPHLFLADVTRWLVARRMESGAKDPLLRAVLAFLENQFESGGAHIKELLAVSVLETLPLKGEAGSEIRDQLGSAMSEHVRLYLTW